MTSRSQWLLKVWAVDFEGKLPGWQKNRQDLEALSDVRLLVMHYLPFAGSLHPEFGDV
jgi:hypothetical protein